jgi:hypothetical protein
LTRYWPWLCAPVLLLLVAALAVNVPMFDEWTWAPLVLAAHDHTLTFGDLWEQQQAHRSVVPTLFMLALAELDAWNVRVEAFLNVVIAFATQLLLFTLFRHVDRERRWGAFALASVLLFSLMQAENWLWGFQMSWFLVNFFVVAVVAAHRLFVQTLAAIGASLSLIFGFGAWVAGLVMFAGRNLRTFVWLVAAFVVATCFLIGYQLPRFENGWAWLSSPLAVAEFVLVYLGGPLGDWGGRIVAEIAGVVLVVAFAFCAREAVRRDVEARPWFALAAFAFVAACFEAAGRAGNGVDAAVALRYVTPSTLGWIALVGLGAQTLEPRWWRLATIALAVFVGIGCIAGYFYSYSLSGIQLDADIAMHHLDDVDDEELSEYTADPEATRYYAAELQYRGLGPYHAIIGHRLRRPRLSGRRPGYVR